MTKRPPSAGDSVQFQTQWWIERFGFYLPSVLTVPGSRGDVANALRLDLLVDDQLINCVEVVSALPDEGDPDAAHARQRRARPRDEPGHRRGVDARRRPRGDRAAAGSCCREKRGRLLRLTEWFHRTRKRRPCRRIRRAVQAGPAVRGPPPVTGPIRHASGGK